MNRKSFLKSLAVLAMSPVAIAKAISIVPTRRPGFRKICDLPAGESLTWDKVNELYDKMKSDSVILYESDLPRHDHGEKYWSMCRGFPAPKARRILEGKG